MAWGENVNVHTEICATDNATWREDEWGGGGMQNSLKGTEESTSVRTAVNYRLPVSLPQAHPMMSQGADPCRRKKTSRGLHVASGQKHNPELESWRQLVAPEKLSL